MKVVYHDRYKEIYASDPAARAGRIECIYEELYDHYKFVKPKAAIEVDLKLVHTQSHIDSIKMRHQLYDIALLAAGGAIRSAQLAVRGESAFGLIRPPGHHASPDSCWGFCFFNNIAISMEKLRIDRKIEKALIVDFDLHYGDGTSNIFGDVPEVSYYHLPGGSREEQLTKISDYLSDQKGHDIIALSAGFDRHVDDWGAILKTEDYREIGKMAKEYAEKECDGKRYAVLEGGYNHQVLGKNVKTFLEGFS